VDGHGNVITSTNPTRGGTAWTVTSIVDHSLNGVSCFSSDLCVAVDDLGDVVTSSNPAAVSPTWTAITVDGGNSLNDVSCPSSHLCIAADGSGNAVTSASPTGGTTAWSVTRVDGADDLFGVACPDTGLCTVLDQNSGSVVIASSSVLRVTAPSIGASWARSSPHAITWSSAGTPGARVKIELLEAGRVVTTVVKSVLTSAGTYTWKIPAKQILATTYQIEIVSATSSSVFGVSGDFAIT
jgi:hypothetical protein